MQGIYKITIKKTNQFYIGKSSRIVERFAKHFNGFNSTFKINHVEEILFEVIEVTDKALRFTLERQLINSYKDNNLLLNRERPSIQSKRPEHLSWVDISDIIMKRYGHIRYTK